MLQPKESGADEVLRGMQVLGRSASSCLPHCMCPRFTFKAGMQVMGARC